MSTFIELRSDATRDFTDPTLFASITTQPWHAEEINGQIYVFFIENLTDAQLQAAHDIATKPDAELQLRDQARMARQTNRDFIDATYPQVTAGADTIINAADASVHEKNLARGLKLVATETRALAAQNNVLINLVLEEVTGA